MVTRGVWNLARALEPEVLSETKVPKMQARDESEDQIPRELSPLCPAVPGDDALPDYFEIDRPSPYMLLVCLTVPTPAPREKED